MKIKQNFMLREIAGSWLVVPLGERVVDFNGIITLSETGAFLWEILEKGAGVNELVDQLLLEYDVDETTARADVVEFIAALEEGALLEL
ncbi:MAG TPA: PqqD family protein [Desulfotomaculum sp.]|nr:MAG: pyrroloquinoline quinone biosynthesis protein [Desulfotomaculum sp. BICA1-6]HBX22962.1 PqqD family protein [Desulfotomaculum sp.]